MDRLDTHVQVNSAEFRDNRARMSQLTAELKARLATVREGGGAKALERHRAQGKWGWSSNC